MSAGASQQLGTSTANVRVFLRVVFPLSRTNIPSGALLCVLGGDGPAAHPEHVWDSNPSFPWRCCSSFLLSCIILPLTGIKCRGVSPPNSPLVFSVPFPSFLAGKELGCCYSNLSAAKSLEARFMGRDNIFY